MNLYRCIGKNGIYALICVAKPAGDMRKVGIPPVHVYLNIATGEFYFRDASDFKNRMELVGSTQIQADKTKQNSKIIPFCDGCLAAGS